MGWHLDVMGFRFYPDRAGQFPLFWICDELLGVTIGRAVGPGKPDCWEATFRAYVTVRFEADAPDKALRALLDHLDDVHEEIGGLLKAARRLVAFDELDETEQEAVRLQEDIDKANRERFNTKETS